jgi:hypothetical protein
MQQQRAHRPPVQRQRQHQHEKSAFELVQEKLQRAQRQEHESTNIQVRGGHVGVYC